jgi:peptidoglycan lytic transglycosylase F
MRHVFFLLILLLSGCGRNLPPPEAGGELVVLTRQGPTTYYEGPDGAKVGLEHDLVTLFAKRQGWHVRFEVEDSLDRLYSRLKKQSAHLAAASLTETPERLRYARFGPQYQKVRSIVVCRADAFCPKTPKDLVGKRVEVLAGSRHEALLFDLALRMPGLEWHFVEDATASEILDRLESGVIDAAVVYSHLFEIERNFHPLLTEAFPIGPPTQLAWAFPRYGGHALEKRAEQFFKDIGSDGTLDNLIHRYYGHVGRLDSADVLGLFERLHTELPRYRAYFRRAESRTGLDWRLLAAIGYQESKWDPLAVSPTGVRGLMMLSLDTAERLGVKNRLDPEQSILGGATYFKMLRQQLPTEISEPDRTWIALAAYNLGYGHLRDAIKLAGKLGDNPYVWSDLRDTLLLLSRRKHYSNLDHGYARGGEARVFVENVRTYYDILLREEKKKKGLFELPFNSRKSMLEFRLLKTRRAGGS